MKETFVEQISEDVCSASNVAVCIMAAADINQNAPAAFGATSLRLVQYPVSMSQ